MIAAPYSVADFVVQNRIIGEKKLRNSAVFTTYKNVRSI